ncbi:MAG: hypothetical protein OHK0039_31410 [Bacteroidia bacterium]
MATYFIIKVKGKAKIPDYIQLRDSDLTLIGYFRPSRQERLTKVIPNEAHANIILDAIEQLDTYGRVTRIDIPDEAPAN